MPIKDAVPQVVLRTGALLGLSGWNDLTIFRHYIVSKNGQVIPPNHQHNRGGDLVGRAQQQNRKVVSKCMEHNEEVEVNPQEEEEFFFKGAAPMPVKKSIPLVSPSVGYRIEGGCFSPEDCVLPPFQPELDSSAFNMEPEDNDFEYYNTKFVNRGTVSSSMADFLMRSLSPLICGSMLSAYSQASTVPFCARIPMWVLVVFPSSTIRISNVIGQLSEHHRFLQPNHLPFPMPYVCFLFYFCYRETEEPRWL